MDAQEKIDRLERKLGAALQENEVLRNEVEELKQRLEDEGISEEEDLDDEDDEDDDPDLLGFCESCSDAVYVDDDHVYDSEDGAYLCVNCQNEEEPEAEDEGEEEEEEEDEGEEDNLENASAEDLVAGIEAKIESVQIANEEIRAYQAEMEADLDDLATMVEALRTKVSNDI